MTGLPVIVISSSRPGCGKTTLALNLAAALWQDKYEVFLLPDEENVFSEFIKKRRALKQKGLPLPRVIKTLAEAVYNEKKKQVVIADIPTIKNEEYADVFSQAHTLITVAAEKADIDWPLSHPYVNLIWNTKKNIAARGIKYLNWIAVVNHKEEQTEDFSSLVEQQAKRLGFRISDSLQFREAYRHIADGYCAADMTDGKNGFKMTMADMYARREILKLTDFLWQQK